jgi:hypothetical protein
MEKNSPGITYGKGHASEGAQKTGIDAGGFSDRVAEAASAISTHSSDAFDEVKAAGQGLVDDYGQLASRGRKRIEKAAGQISEYAHKNIAVLMIGALSVGIVIGHILTRRDD